MPVQVYVEDGEIEVPGLGEFEGFINPAGDAGQFVTEVREHIFQQHADQELVFDHENTTASLGSRFGGRVHAKVPVVPISDDGI